MVLQQTPLFKDLTPQQLAAIADCLAPITFASDSLIIRQGDPITSSSKFYIVEEGQVDCFRADSKVSATPCMWRNRESAIAAFKSLMYAILNNEWMRWSIYYLQGNRKATRFIGPNDVFGEVALLTDQPRQADCVAKTEVKVRNLD